MLRNGHETPLDLAMQPHVRPGEARSATEDRKAPSGEDGMDLARRMSSSFALLARSP